jgi:hypothetical protein
MFRLVLSSLPLTISKSALSVVKVRALVVVSVSGSGETTTKTITVTVTDLDDEAPTNIQINDADTDINGFVTFKISTVGGKSKGISSSISIWIGSTESTNHKSDTLVIGKNQSTDKDFTIKVVDAKKIVPLMITTPDVSVPEKTENICW